MQSSLNICWNNSLNKPCQQRREKIQIDFCLDKVKTFSKKRLLNLFASKWHPFVQRHQDYEFKGSQANNFFKKLFITGNLRTRG